MRLEIVRGEMFGKPAYLVQDPDRGGHTMGYRRSKSAATALAKRLEKRLRKSAGYAEQRRRRGRDNPAAFTKKGERMYEDIKRGYGRDPRAKEIAARTVYARSKEGARGLVRRKRNPVELEPDAWTKLDELEEEGASRISYGDIDRREWGQYDVPLFTIEHAGGSDYSGGTVEMSNYQVLEEMAEEDEEVANSLVFAYGGYGTFAAFIRLDRPVPEELIDVVSALANYPLLDEDHHSRLEMEMENDQWEAYGREDWRKALADSHLGLDHQDVIEDDLSDEGLDYLWYEVAGPHLSWNVEFHGHDAVWNFDEGENLVEEEDLADALRRGGSNGRT